LEAFRQIGIKVWMLTGDHPFTAVSIAYSCGLIEKSYQVFMVTSPKFEDINNKLIEVIDSENEHLNSCLVVTGDALITINRSVGLRNIFLMALKKSSCVICSRVSPKQKAELVLMVKKSEPHRTTLAIGDGANDVNMINSADVGIGIMGNEGQQAARASDYVIGQFSFLRRLMFVHGREAYRKNAFAVGYILWKNFLYVTPIICYGVCSYFSGQSFYDPILDTMYNIIFTAYPIGWFATYDKETNYDKLESKPKLYEIGMYNERFNTYVFWRWYFYAAAAGLLIFWINTSVMPYILNEEFLLMDLWATGSSIYTCIVFVVNLKIMISTNTHNIFSVILLFFSMSSYIIILWISSRIDKMQTLGQWNYIINSRIFFLTIILIVTASILCEYGWRSITFIIKHLIMNKKSKGVSISKAKGESIISCASFEDLVASEKGFEVKFNNSINIYKEEAYEDTTSKDGESEKDDEVNQLPSQNNTDQTVLTNKHRKCN
jgi:magnesium-transporting ATPase (P-type)